MTTTSSLLEGSSGSGALYTFELVRTGNLNQVSTVSWTIAGSGTSPASASDFINGVFPSGTVTFQPGQTTASITVRVAADSLVESDEIFNVVLSGASAGTSVSASVASATILNDDALLSIAPAQTSSPNWEGTGVSTPVTFTVSRSGFLNQATTVNWSVLGTGTNAATAADFTGYNGAMPSGIVSFAAGESAKTVTVNVAGDTDVEPLWESFNVVLANPNAGASISATQGSAIGWISNDDGTPLLSLSPATRVLSEGTATAGITGTTTDYTFTINRSVNLSGTSSVNWSVAGAGTNPTDAADFSGQQSGTVTFAPGVGSAQVTIRVARDALYEPEETFALTLTNPVNAAISGASSATGTITNDDTSWRLSYTSAADASKSEGNTGFVTYSYTVTRLGPDMSAATVQWRLSGVGTSPADASDFSNTPFGVWTPLSFAANEISKTFTVSVAADSLVEANENFLVSINSAAPAIGVLPNASALTSTIVNDDASVGVFPGTSGNDNISGTNGNDTIYGFAGNDTINGSGGNDILDGGLGNDILTGGAGFDAFDFTGLLDGSSNVDTILDFSRDDDVIRLDNAVMVGLGLATGALSANAFVSGAGRTTAADASDRIIYNTTTGDLYYDADGIGGVAAVKIAVIGTTTRPVLDHTDFLII
jgi:Ca2+-binding RTX toxin-like protein